MVKHYNRTDHPGSLMWTTWSHDALDVVIGMDGRIGQCWQTRLRSNGTLGGLGLSLTSGQHTKDMIAYQVSSYIKKEKHT